jgi:NAD(P)-dependent dehydrogenase (short-subunit alcohol dehydrogenase family)
MEIRFDGRTALVTGAGGGLGRSHALLLAARGAKVVDNDPAPATGGQRPADAVAAEIAAAGGTALADYGSVTDPAAAEAMVAAAVDAFGGIDILVNNAGFLRDRTFAKMTTEEFEQVLAVHLCGAAWCSRAAWPHMRAAGYGRIVMTTSNAGLYGNFGQANYAAGKMGLVGLMNVLRIEGLRYGILVNCLAPMAATPMTEAVLDDATKAAFDPALASAAMGWLCSEACTETGRIVAAAGGYFAQVKVLSSAGVLAPAGRPVTPETVAALWPATLDFSDPQEFDSAQAEMAHIARLRAAAAKR